MMIPWVYDKGTSTFLYEQKSGYDPVSQAVAELPRHPDPTIERCDQSVIPVSIRIATVQEIADYQAEKKEAQTVVLAQAALQALGAEVLDLLDQAITVLNQCRNEAAHTQRSVIPVIDRPQFWTNVKTRFKGFLP